MPLSRPAETVRLVFEASLARDHRRLCALMHPDVRARGRSGATLRGIDGVRAWLASQEHGPRTEYTAHRFESSGDEVIAYGRVRVLDGPSLTDSPAAWRFRVRDGVVVSVAPETP
jgi:ketosteroid isomerase-like protein